MELSKGNKVVVLASQKGYTCDKHGNIFNPSGVQIKPMHKKSKDRTPYYVFSPIASRKITVHRFIAYLKFGEKVFESGVQVRHLDNDSLNNSWDNLELGSMSENAMDRPEDERLEHSLKASAKNRKFSNAEMDGIKSFYKENKSYKKTMEEFGIKSKGTLHRILNTQYKTV